MSSVLELLMDWALQPLGLVFLLLLLTVIGGWWRIRKFRPEYTLLVLTLAVLWVSSSPGVSNALIHRLETARENPPDCQVDPPQWLVVPSGGLDKYVRSSSPYEILDRDSLLRVSLAVDLANSHSEFILLGGGGHARKPGPLMRQVLLDRGIDHRRIRHESESRSTFENARALRRLLPPSEAPRITLVTSALHIARAAATFEAQGYVVCHAGADSQYSPAVFPVSIMPYLSALQKSTRAFHEILGRWVYQARGYL